MQPTPSRKTSERLACGQPMSCNASAMRAAAAQCSSGISSRILAKRRLRIVHHPAKGPLLHLPLGVLQEPPIVPHGLFAALRQPNGGLLSLVDEGLLDLNQSMLFEL